MQRDTATQGVESPNGDRAEVRNNVYVVASNWFVNRCPLVTRVPRVPVGSATFTTASRPRRSPTPTTTPRTLGESIVARWKDESEARPVSAVQQFCETWQSPVRAAGKPAEVWAGKRTPFGPLKMEALQNLMDDMEYSSYYGRGKSPDVAGRPKQKGLRTLFTTNLTTRPVNGDSYGPADFVRDTLEKCRSGGGDPDVLLVSPDFMGGFEAWGTRVAKVDAGVSVFNKVIDVFEAPFLGGVSVIEAPLLRPGTAVCLTSSEIRMRMKRNEFWNPRGDRGDAYEGDWIAEGAVEVDDQEHHAWVEGVTGFKRF